MNKTKKTRAGLRSLVAGVLTLGAAFALTAVTGTPAAAHYSQCPDKEFCIWQHTNYEGLFAYSSKPRPDLGDMSGRASSYWNRTDNWVSLYVVEDFQACFESVPPGGSISNMGSIWNDELRSFRPGKFC
ncbi:peptidase inhibitor family I36 protein [Streptomyces sp. NPDC050416]|uniref:peptidase inhibitor family I36 protein n=1 Tax=Streptomyces sp. NPDC050416 TaxID=3365611 RepID=UPI0037B973FD